MATINDLPSEILLHIFSFYALEEPHARVHTILRKVCQTWENVLTAPQFWKTLDGSVTFTQFQTMCKKEMLVNAEDVTLPALNKSSVKQLEKLFSKLPNLKRIDFSNVNVWDEQIFKQLQPHCPKLCEIVMSNINTRRDKIIIAQMFEQILEVKGCNITYFDFSHSYISNVSKLLILISKFCPNLEKLVAHNLSVSSTSVSFPIGEFQKGCSKLKVLQLGHPFKYNMKISNPSQGFPELEVFSHFSSFDYSFTDSCLQKLLFQSTKLKSLDLRGCSMLTAKSFLSLTSENVERLYISGTRILFSKQLLEILTKWRHSLVELDVAKMDSEDINDIFLKLVSWNHMPCIKYLFVSGTKLDPHTLKEILLNCPKLIFLQLEGCRRIGRGLMRSHQGRKEIEKLLNTLEDSNDRFPLLTDGLQKHC